MRILPRIAGATSLLCSVGCGGGGDPVKPTPPTPTLSSLTVSPAVASVRVGEQLTMSVTARDQFGASIATGTVSWSSSNSSLATVTTSGVVTGVVVGNVGIVASTSNMIANASLTVTPAAPVLSRLVIGGLTSSIASGQTVVATASGIDQYGAAIAITGGTLAWSSSSPSVATVASDGGVTGILVGQAIIRASIGSATGTFAATVTPGVATGLRLSQSAAGAMNYSALRTPAVVSVIDAAGNTVTNDNGRMITVGGGAGATLSGPTTRTSTLGSATFLGLGVSGIVGSSYGLSFTAGGLSSISQNVLIEPFSFGAGVRIVGAELPAATYRSLTSATGNCYWARLSGFGGTTGEILANDIRAGPAVVQVLATDKGFTSNGCAAWSELAGPITSSPSASFGVGTFLVGTDIAPGTWRSDATGTDCYWARLRNVLGANDIIANDIGTPRAIVTISSTDVAFQSSRCGTWTKIS